MTRSFVFALILAGIGGCGGGGGGPEVLIVPLQANLGPIAAHQPSVRTVTVPNETGRPGTAEFVGFDETAPAVGLPAGGFAATLTAESLAFDLRLEPGDPGERFSAVLRVRLRFGAATEEILVRVAGHTEDAQIVSDPRVVDFGLIRPGEPRFVRVTLLNGGQHTPVTVESVDADPLPGLTVESDPVGVYAPRAERRLDLRFRFAEQGALEGTVTIRHDRGEFPIVVRALAEPWPERMTTDYGEVQLVGGATDWLEVFVPTDGVGLLLEATGAEDSQLDLLALEGPGGIVYRAPGAPDDLVLSGDVYPQLRSAFAFQLPSTRRPEEQLVSGGGNYRFRLHQKAGSATSLQVRAVVTNRLEGDASQGVLDLNIFLAPAVNIAAAEASDDTTIGVVLTEIETGLAKADIRLGDVAFYDLPDATFDELTSSEIAAAGRATAAADEDRLNLFLVQSVQTGALLGLGVSFSVPNTLARGTAFSGCAVRLHPADPVAAGGVAIHEIGHALGLYHFGDHPAQGPDEGSNYMFGIDFGEEEGDWNATQEYVMRRHPLVRSGR